MVSTLISMAAADSASKNAGLVARSVMFLSLRAHVCLVMYYLCNVGYIYTHLSIFVCLQYERNILIGYSMKYAIDIYQCFVQ